MGEYKAGEKVLHAKYGAGTIKEISYVFVEFGGMEMYVHTNTLESLPKFEVGDVVVAYSRKHIVKSGAYVDGDGTRSYVTLDMEAQEFHMVPEDDIR